MVKGRRPTPLPRAGLAGRLPASLEAEAQQIAGVGELHGAVELG
jgi:hypothetical protein